MKNKYKIILAGGLIGILSAILVEKGNPGNMGVCVACFIRDIAGSLGLHSVEKLSYIRPEIIGPLELSLYYCILNPSAATAS